MQGQPIFVRSWLIRLRSVSSEHYALVHPSSGALIATDRLGYRALGRLMAGASVQQVAQWLDTVSTDASTRLPLLTDALAAVAALSETAPKRGVRWWLRLTIAHAIGFTVSLSTAIIPYLPLGLLATLFRWLPRAVLARHMRKQSGWYLEYVLDRSGYGTRSPAWHATVAQRICAASMRTYMLVFLAVLLPPTRARALLDRLVTVRGEGLTSPRRAAGAVVACLHCDSFTALLLYHALQGHASACVVRPWMANTALGTAQRGGGWLEPYLGQLIPAQNVSAGRGLIRHIRAGGLAFVPFDTTPLAPDRSPTLPFLGRHALANEGPAWLAAHTGAPLFLATTRFEGNMIVLEYTEVLPPRAPAAALPDAGALTARLYQRAETQIQGNPGGWIGWTFFEQVVAPEPARPTAAESQTAERAAIVDPVMSRASTLAGEAGRR